MDGIMERQRERMAAQAAAQTARWEEMLTAQIRGRGWQLRHNSSYRSAQPRTPW
jgi:hypothetical protein